MNVLLSTFSTEPEEIFVEIMGQILQSCYKHTLRTFCTRERRAPKAFRMNMLSRIHVQLSIHTGEFDQPIFLPLLMVGPREFNTNYLRQHTANAFKSFKCSRIF